LYNCCNKIEENNIQISSEVSDYLQDKIKNKENYDIYRIVVDIIMIVLGFCVFLVSTSDEHTITYELLGYDITLGFMLPGLITLVAGILSIVSRKVNSLLLVSGILYLVAGLCNLCGISDVSFLLILCIIFGTFNIVFYSKTNSKE
jgi:hypothetical protein